MKYSLRSLIIALALLPAIDLAGATEAVSQAEADCAEARSLEAEMNKSLPQQIDQITVLNRLSVDCPSKTITYTKRLLIQPAQLRDGWIAREQRLHTDRHCQEGGLAATSGWIAKDTLLGPDHSHVVTFATRPSDCPVP